MYDLNHMMGPDHFETVEAPELPGLYVHIPFCRTKCPYCGFYSITSLSMIELWLQALEKEVGRHKDGFGPFETLYVGGGTPSVLESRDLGRIIDTVSRHLDLSQCIERTVECNPGDVTLEKAQSLKAMGFNRVSLGVQSFDDGELTFLGRRHTAEEAVKAFKALRAAGFEDVGLDLIYGLPGQREQAWAKNLRKAVQLEPEHLSCYQLTMEKGTVFSEMVQDGRLILPVQSRLQRQMAGLFLMTSRLLGAEGYIHYEVSNFARGKARFSRHNLKYWRHIPYLGLGPSAHSFRSTTRWWNVRSVDRYLSLLQTGQSPVEGTEELTPEQLTLESIALGLRTREGCAESAIPSAPRVQESLSMLMQSGLLFRRGHHIVPTRKGYLVADSLPLYLT
jgi:oxygen-independent coproporphyrinogen-3 oxidase